MEPHAAVVLTKDNPILRACNIEVGIFIADNDSSSICAVRAANDHEVLKQSDKNHTCKGVVGEIYKISKNFKELTSSTIQYLKKCFNYCVSQNQGAVMSMAKAIKNIPYHAFNHHNDCGNRCSYKSNPENYQHTNIGDGFKDSNLFEALKHIFDNLALKTSQFVSGASSNPNESLNAMIMSSGIHRDKFCKDVDLFNEKKNANSLTRAAKSRRVALKKNKTALKNRHEAKEGTTYESNIGLRDFIHESIPIVTIKDCKAPFIVFFDLETGSFSKTSDILQITAKHEYYEFSVYVKPIQTISEEASKVHGLRLVLGKLELHGDNKLENIARELEINNDKAHDALYDVVMLSEVLKQLNITSDDLISSSFTWDDACNKIKFAENLPKALKDLELLKDCVSVDYCGFSSYTNEQHIDLCKNRINQDKEDTDRYVFWLNEHAPFANRSSLLSLSTGIVGGQNIDCHLAVENGLTAMASIEQKMVITFC
ncbi:uncharacterized protein LOC130670506 [Microplitis mediator]|uniref:uncharacterized protein LOC130670506 n=1 Tax=Microplitis mediator TaxID=375433 RepID=UPI002553DF58|nr:uncharacterized protein LOC130670506 [Microplitis mediator]